jgi:hypothetical protein
MTAYSKTQLSNPTFLNGNNHKWHKVTPQWTKDNPLPVADIRKLKQVNCGDWFSNKMFKRHLYMLCPCSDRPFKYSHLCQHKQGVKHQDWQQTKPVCPPATTTKPKQPRLRHDWYTSTDLDGLIKDTERLPDTTYNTAKLDRLRYVKNHGYHLCKCGSACKQKIKAHLHSDLHKSWVLHGRPSRILLRVRGFNDLVTE